MSRRVREKRTTQNVEFLNSVLGDQEIINRDSPKTRASRRNKKSSRRDGSEDRHEKGLRDTNQRQTRSSSRLKKDTPREKGAVAKDSEDSLFVEQDSSDDSEEDKQPNKVADEGADEAEEAEEDRSPDDDGSSISSEDNDSIPEDEQQLHQEQEQAIKVLISSASAPADKSPTPTNAEPVNQALESQPLGNDETQQENEIIEESPHITPVTSPSRDVSGWPRPQTPAAAAKAMPVNSLARQLQATPESSHRKRRRESTDSETELQRNARRRHTLNIAHDTTARNDAVFPASAPRMAMPSSSRPLSTSFFRRPEHNRTSDPVFIRNRTPDAIISGAQPRPSALTVPSALEDVDSLLSSDAAVELFSSDSEEKEVDAEPAAVHISPYDDAMKIVDLQRSWKRLMDNCRIVKAIDSDEDQQYRRVEELERRLTDMINDYRRIQRQRSTGRIVASNEWDRLRQEAKITARNTDKLLKYLQKPARRGLEDNDLQAQINAIEYAKLIYKKVMTGLSEVALECLKAYYADEDEWLMPGGFSAVLDILEIAGRIDSTLTALHKCRVLMLSPDPGRHMRIELRNIQKSLAEAETYETSRGR